MRPNFDKRNNEIMTQDFGAASYGAEFVHLRFAYVTP